MGVVQAPRPRPAAAIATARSTRKRPFRPGWNRPIVTSTRVATRVPEHLDRAGPVGQRARSVNCRLSTVDCRLSTVDCRLLCAIEPLAVRDELVLHAHRGLRAMHVCAIEEADRVRNERERRMQPNELAGVAV